MNTIDLATWLALPFARLSRLRTGAVLIADDGFTCIRPSAECVVCEGASGGLAVLCDEGEHNLDGQLDDDDGDTLVGFRLKPASGEVT